MKTKFSVLVFALGCLLTLASCNNDDDNYLPDQTITNAFKAKYPNVDRVEWETKAGYQVADFHIDSNEAEAWFDDKGQWLMTEIDIPFNSLPSAIQESFNLSDYKSWKVDDVDKLERFNTATVYIIEVEQGEQEADLYYAEDGTLIKTTTDTDSDGNFPVEIPQTINDEISKMYPGSTILEFDKEHDGIEVDILHNGIHKEVVFNSNNGWSYTEWDIKKADVPAIVIDTLNASEYKDFSIDDIDCIEKPDGIFYLFELEQGDREVRLMISAEGKIIS